MSHPLHAFFQALPPGLSDSFGPAIRDTPRFQLLILGQPAGEEARLWQQYRGQVTDEIAEVPEALDTVAKPDPVDHQTALLLFICENAPWETALQERQLLEMARPFPVVVATLPNGWAESPEWAGFGKAFPGYFHVRTWANLAHTCLELDQRQLTLGGNPALEQPCTYWRHLRAGRQIDRLKRELLREKDRLTAVRLVLGMQLRQLQDKKEDRNPISNLRKQIETRFQQLEQFLQEDWETLFLPDTGTWTREVAKAIKNIETFPRRKESKKEVLHIAESTLQQINAHFQAAGDQLIRQFAIYEQTTLTLCAALWQDELGEASAPKLHSRLTATPTAERGSKVALPANPFETSIATKGLKDFLMASRQAPMYLFMFFSVLAMSGVSIYQYRSEAWFQVGMLSLVILGGLYAWYQHRQDKQTSIEEAAHKAREALLQAVQKMCEQWLKERIEEIVVKNRKIYFQGLDEIEQERKAEEIRESRKKQAFQKFLEESIRAKNDQERQLENAFRQLETLERNEQKAFQDWQRITKTTQNNNTHGIDRRINAAHAPGRPTGR